MNFQNCKYIFLKNSKTHKMNLLGWGVGTKAMMARQGLSIPSFSLRSCNVRTWSSSLHSIRRRGRRRLLFADINEEEGAQREIGFGGVCLFGWSSWVQRDGSHGPDGD